MKPTTILLTFLGIAAAMPDPATESTDAVAGASRRRRLEITFCRIENFEDCDIIQAAEHDLCNAVPASLNDRIRSISFHGADQCTFYNDVGCTGRSFTDAGSVPEVHKKFRDRISSYRCT
ncbi:hypothetical protein Sste5346_006534 [Sporothrix stenoceras]|uniref:Beta/gamma crystallin 'Greek key' domain-containing protein n=1 Tax=Sporothrix stenoceras TaxID=5173 RepID=A0ABR3YYC5_9PEZI